MERIFEADTREEANRKADDWWAQGERAALYSPVPNSGGLSLESFKAMGDYDPLQGRGISFLSGMRNLVSFVERTRVKSALAIAFLISVAWVAALSLMLRTVPTHSVNAASNPPLQHASQPARSER